MKSKAWFHRHLIGLEAYKWNVMFLKLTYEQQDKLELLTSKAQYAIFMEKSTMTNELMGLEWESEKMDID